MPRIRYDFYLDPEQLEALRAVKARDGISPSEQIRRAIDLWLARKAAKVRAERTRAATRARS
jgi:hypothetical protein